MSSPINTALPEASKPAENGGGTVKPPTIIKTLSDQLRADLFIYSGPIERPYASKFLDIVETNKHSENVALIICTHGGDPDAAYIMARFLKCHYKRFTLYVFGHCKSAGTLLALGANE